jgi:hypothetical protein
MARPAKNNLEYFSHDNKMRNDRKIKALRAKFGLTGYAVYCMMLECLSESDLLIIEWNEIEIELVSGDFTIVSEELIQIIDYCCYLGLLNRSNGYLFCKKLDIRADQVFGKRVYNLDQLRTEKGINVTETPVSEAETPDLQPETPISEQKTPDLQPETPQNKRKEKKSKEKVYNKTNINNNNKSTIDKMTNNNYINNKGQVDHDNSKSAEPDIPVRSSKEKTVFQIKCEYLRKNLTGKPFKPDSDKKVRIVNDKTLDRIIAKYSIDDLLKWYFYTVHQSAKKKINHFASYYFLCLEHNFTIDDSLLHKIKKQIKGVA